jgi:hypothetical protein
VLVLLSVVFWLNIRPFLLLLPFPCCVMTFLGEFSPFGELNIFFSYLFLFIAKKNHQNLKNDSKI